MSAVVSVFVIWFGLVVVLGAFGIVVAPRIHVAGWMRAFGERMARGRDGSVGAFGRFATGAVVWLAGWAVVIIVGWLLGLLAHKLQNSVDWPAFHWFQAHRSFTGFLSHDWSKAWKQLTKIGSPQICQPVCVVAFVGLALCYLRRPFFWLPSVCLAVAYVAEFHAQVVLKDVVHRGHPPTTLGSWPSGGMGRIMALYGLIIFFVIFRFWAHKPRVWAAGGLLLMLLESVQGYARIYNLEHWVTDVVGGFFFGGLVLAMRILGYLAITRGDRRPTEPRAPTVA